MIQSKHAFKVISVLKSLLEGKEVKLGNVNYKLFHTGDSFEITYSPNESIHWRNSHMDFEFFTKLCGHLTNEEIMEINIR